MQKKLEDLIAGVEKTEQAVREGYRVDLRELDAASLEIHKALKAKPDPALKPLLMQAVAGLERLAAALEAQVADLKKKKR